MSATQNTLVSISPAAEKALFGWPQWTAIDSEINSPCTASAAVKAGYSNATSHVTVSFSQPAATALELQILDGSSVIWQVEIGAGILTMTENFETRPLAGNVGNALSAVIGAAGTSVTQTVAMAGFWVKGA